MKNKLWLFILMIIGLAILQLAIEGNIQILGGKINLPLVALVILISLADFSWVMALAVSIGIFMDVYSGLPFGILTLTFFLLAIILEVMFLNFFTNFSLYSLLILGLLATVVYNLIFIFLILIIYFFGLSDSLPQWEYGYKIIWQLVSTEMLFVGAFFAINRWSLGYRPAFLK